jgi:glycosyltransferase involved in cell wall biosynthesis
MQPPAPLRNVVALSEWQAERFRRIQKQECRVLDPICGDGDYLVPGSAEDVGGHPEGLPSLQDDYLLFVGILSPDKGALEAVRICKSLKQKLHLSGPTPTHSFYNRVLQEYADSVLAECDGVDIVHHGEVSETVKVMLMQGAKALLYTVGYPPGKGEAHSHKSIEAMLCGTPCIIYDQGAMAEVIDQGVTGLVILGREALPEAIKACETMDRVACRARAVERWDYRNVVARWLPVMEEVSRGARW